MNWKDMVAASSYGVLRTEVALARLAWMRSLSTGRNFAMYRRLFFEGRSEAEVLASLRAKRIVDVGCGTTPYLSDSMFRVCHREGIDFYGVDPLLARGPRSPGYARLWARIIGSRGDFSTEIPAPEKALGTTAEAIPLEQQSVDLIMASMSLFIWVDEEAVLAAIFREFERLLVPGGEIHIYPLPPWRLLRWREPALREVFSRFSVSQVFVQTGLRVVVLPAYRTIFRKR